MQDLAVGLIVLLCMLYAVWALLPQAWRRLLATWLLKARWPGFVARALRRATDAGGCGCKGCDRATPTPRVGGEQTVRFHPRRR